MGKAKSLSYRHAGRDLNTEQLQSPVGERPSPAPLHHLHQALLGSETIRALHGDNLIEMVVDAQGARASARSDVTEVAATVTGAALIAIKPAPAPAGLPRPRRPAAHALSLVDVCDRAADIYDRDAPMRT
jgi:hypothetical protein